MTKPKKMDIKTAAARNDVPVVRLRPHSYQPSRAELRAPVVLPPGTTPEMLAKAAVRVVRVVEDE